MERRYAYNFKQQLDVFKQIVESQLEFLVENEFGNIANIVNNLTNEQYEKLIIDLANDFSEDIIWEDIDKRNTELITERLKQFSD